MFKLYASLVTALASIISANVYSNGITVADQKNAVSIDEIKFSQGLEGHIDLKAYKHFRLYVDSTAVDMVGSEAQKPVQCNYVVILGQDNSIKLGSGDPKCTNKEVRAAARPYKEAQFYMKGSVVSFANPAKSTLALYQCFDTRLCAAEGYDPEGPLGDEAWVLISKRYVTTEKNNASHNEGAYHLDFSDHKHAAYLESTGQDLPLKATLTPRADNTGYISFYVDAKKIYLVAKSTGGIAACNYAVTLNLDNSIVIKSTADGCFNGYAREASGPYKEGVMYKKGDLVIEKDYKKHINHYYQCVVSSLCNKDGYAPLEPYSSLAWSLVYSKRLPSKKQAKCPPEEL